MSGSLEINVQLAPGTAELSLVGDLDPDNIGSLIGCLVHLDVCFGTVVLDLASLESLDPSAAHALVALQDEMAVRLQHLECRNASGAPARVLELTGVAASLAAP